MYMSMNESVGRRKMPRQLRDRFTNTGGERNVFTGLPSSVKVMPFSYGKQPTRSYFLKGPVRKRKQKNTEKMELLIMVQIKLMCCRTGSL